MIQALTTEPEERTSKMMKELKTFAQNQMTFMENSYCTNDDYKYAGQSLKYRFVPKGHFVIRQGEVGSEVFFIIQGTAHVVIYGPEDKGYLDSKQIYNEQSIKNSKKQPLVNAKGVILNTNIDHEEDGTLRPPEDDNLDDYLYQDKQDTEDSEDVPLSRRKKGSQKNLFKEDEQRSSLNATVARKVSRAATFILSKKLISDAMAEKLRQVILAKRELLIARQYEQGLEDERNLIEWVTEQDSFRLSLENCQDDFKIKTARTLARMYGDPILNELYKQNQEMTELQRLELMMEEILLEQRSRVVKELTDGDQFGEQSIIRDFGIRTASIRCTEDTHLAYLEKSDFEKIYYNIMKTKQTRRVEFLKEIPLFS